MIIFVSYSSKNDDLARALAVQMGVYGYDIQFEQKVLGGQVGWHEVFDSIRACDLFVLAVTERSIDSYSCQLEYSYANTLGKRILPVVIEDIDDALLRQHFGNAYVRWRLSPEHQSGLEQLLREIAEQEALPPPAIPPLRPDWLNAMVSLRDSVIALPQGPRAQFSILDNLAEFLERDDSLPEALELIRLLQTNPQLAQPVALELEQTLQKLNQNRNRQNSPQRARRFLRDAGLFVGGALLILIIARALQFFNRSGGEVPELTAIVTEEATQVAGLLNGVATDEVAAVTTRDLTVEQIALEVQGTVTAAIGTAIAVASYTVTPLPSDTPTAPPQATDAPTSTPDTAGTRNAVNLQNTATAAVGTALAVGTSMASTADNTAVPPTLTPIPSATALPATVVPATVPPETSAPTLNFQEQLTAVATSTALVYVGMQVEDTEQGVRISAVGNSARQAGVRVGDYVTAVDVETFNDRAGFLDIMNRRRAFTQVTFRLVRGNSTIYIRVPLQLLDYGSPSAAAPAS